MKTLTAGLFTAISAEAMTSLTREVKETLDAPARHSGKILSAADVWNIQRNKKSRVQRRVSL